MSLRRNAAFSFSFAAIDSQYAPARKSALTIAAADIWLTKDGATTAVNATNGAIEIANMPGRYSLTLTAAEMDCTFLHVAIVDKPGMDPEDWTFATHGGPSGAVIADVGNTTLTFKTDRTEATNDVWKNTLCLFTTGALAGQIQKVTGYDGATKFLSFSTGFTAAPAGTDRFVLVNI